MAMRVAFSRTMVTRCLIPQTIAPGELVHSRAEADVVTADLERHSVRPVDAGTKASEVLRCGAVVKDLDENRATVRRLPRKLVDKARRQFWSTVFRRATAKLQQTCVRSRLRLPPMYATCVVTFVPVTRSISVKNVMATLPLR
jgi:hypothetical protein